MIDVTLGGPEINISKWKYLDYDSLSDHTFIYFEIADRAACKRNTSIKVIRGNQVDQGKLRSIFKSKIITKTKPNLKTADEIDKYTKYLADQIISSLSEAKLRRYKT